MTAFSGSRRTIFSGTVIVFAAALAYGNSGSGAFVLDDEPSILDNSSIRHLWPIWKVLTPAHGGMTVSGRPLVNLSLAVNYALGGLDRSGYHLFNLIVHILAGLVLFGVVRRTLDPGVPALPAKASTLSCNFLALAIALLWTLHPMQTESVTYIIQRAEAMMGLFYLLTLYCFIRYAGGRDCLAARVAAAGDGAQNVGMAGEGALRGNAPAGFPSGSPEAGRAGVSRLPWAWLAIVFCLFGMACKEVIVSAPVIVFLYDRTFISGSFREAWRRRRGFYFWLASSWAWLAWLVAQSGNRGGTSGWGTGVSPGGYWLTQFPAIARYLRLSVWPHPLIFDYGTIWVRSAWTVLPSAFAVFLLGGVTAFS